MSEPMTNAIHCAPSGIIDKGEPEPQKKISSLSKLIDFALPQKVICILDSKSDLRRNFEHI